MQGDKKKSRVPASDSSTTSGANKKHAKYKNKTTPKPCYFDHNRTDSVSQTVENGCVYGVCLIREHYMPFCLFRAFKMSFSKVLSLSVHRPYDFLVRFSTGNFI